MVVVPGEGIAEFQLVLPADVNAPDHADFFEDPDRSVDARTVHIVQCGSTQLAHGLRLFARQQTKHRFALSRNAVAARFQKIRNLV